MWRYFKITIYKQTRYLFFLLLCATATYSQQDLSRNYTPLKSSGTLPPAFTRSFRDLVKQDLAELRKNKDADQEAKSTFYAASGYAIEAMIRSGNALFNDEITQYLNEIKNIVMKDNPKVLSELNIFTFKSAVVNAYSYDKGYIFLNIGLIAQAESEAQLAYILCHEISHYTKKHQINGYVKNSRADKTDYDGGNYEDRLIEKCQYSKEVESEGDMEGMKIFQTTAYDLRQAEKGFDVLQYAHLPFELVEFKKSFFESPGYVFPERYFLKEVSAIKDNSNEDDTKLTHPNTKKRKLAVAQVIEKLDESNRKKYIVGKEKFEYIRDLARMELCRLHLKNRDYAAALYSAYILAGKYPGNQYVQEIIIKSLYGIALVNRGELGYYKRSFLPEGMPSYKLIESYPQQLYQFIQKIPENEWTILSLNYSYRASKKFPDNRAIAGITDSLFKLMERTRWGITDFARKPEVEVKSDTVVRSSNTENASKTELIASLQKQSAIKTEDTIYYKKVFLDLFTSDKEFAKKFPWYGLPDNTESGQKKKAKPGRDKTPKLEKTDTLLLLEPFFYKVDEREKEGIQYVASDEKQEGYAKIINTCSERLNLQIKTLDSRKMSAEDAESLNDLSVVNDWFYEKFDSQAERRLILNNNEISRITSKYNTRYVLRTGVVTLITKSGFNRTYLYSFLFDVKNNTLVYRKYERFKTKDKKDLLNAKTYQMLFELKHRKNSI